MRKLLMLVPCDIFPPMHGGGTRVRFTIKYLLETNQLNVLLNHVYSLRGKRDLHHPNLAIRYCPKTILDTLGYRLVLFNPFYLRESYKLLRDTNSDIIHCELLWSAFSGIMLKEKFKKPLILVNHNIEYLKFKELGKITYSYLLRKIEQICCEQADKIAVTSEVDKSHIVTLYGIPEEKIHVIHNCTDPEIFKYSIEGRKRVRQRYEIDDETTVITFVGNLGYIPNVTAVRYIAEEVYPIIMKKYQNSRFLIVGANYEHLLKYQRQNIIFTGYVDNLPDFLSASDIVIIPLDAGSGTRLKILEAASCSRPIVSTRKGMEGHDFLDNKEILITDGIDQNFTENVLRLIEDERLRENLGKNARKKIESQYKWREEIKKFEEIYEEVCKQ